MRLKKLFAAVTAVLVLLAAALAPTVAFAAVRLQDGVPVALPGHPQCASPDYGMAWLDSVIIRDSATSILTARIVPQAEYPYSHTFDLFADEVNYFALLNALNDENVGQAYDEAVELFYYTATAMGMTDDLPTMIAYLEEYGIVLPSNPTAQDTPAIAMVYAALRYDAVYSLYEKEVTLPRGITLEAAEIIILSELSGVFLPSGVNTLNGLAVQAMKTYVQEFPVLPLSRNPSNAEIFHWAKVLTAAAQGYKVPLTPYENANGAQKEYVDYAYFASMLDTAYDVKLNPARLSAAHKSGQKNAVQTTVLKAMLDEKGVGYDETASCEALFDLACQSGCFPLDEEFYSDIFTYDLYVDGSSERVWFTPLALASQLGGSDDNVQIYLNGAEMRPSQTVATPLDLSKTQELIELTVVYDDGTAANHDTVTYTFHVIKNGETAVAGKSNDFLSKMQTLLDSAVPAETGAAQTLVNSVLNFVQKQEDSTAFDLSNIADFDVEIASIPNQDDLFTVNAQEEQSSGYLSQILGETYAADEITVPGDSALHLDKPAGNDASLGTRAWTAIKENPEIAAAPTGIIALGGLAGYVWSKKRKDALQVAEEEEDDSFPDLTSDFHEEELK